MTALFVQPKSFSGETTSPTPFAGSVANLNNDLPGLIWRGGITSYLIVDLGANPGTYDYIGLFGGNLRGNVTVQIQTGTTTIGTGSYTGQILPAFSGYRDTTQTSQAIFKLASTRNERYVRIDLSVASHPDGYLQFSRLVIGQSITADGIELGAQHSFESQSVIETGPGYRSVDNYGSLDAWKISTSWINADAWRTKWAPLLRYTAAGGGVMFIADDSTPDNWQSDAVYGFMGVTPVGTWDAANAVRFETKITAYSK